MSSTEDLLKIDSMRREAMISGDTATLANILSDDLVWTHSSGKTESKQDMLQAIETKAVSYEILTIPEYSITRHDDLFIYLGVLDGKASRDGIEKDLMSKFLSVWRLKDSTFEMLAWQSTAC